MKVWIVTWKFVEPDCSGTAYRAFSTYAKAQKFVVKEASKEIIYDWKNADERARRNGEVEYACALLGANIMDLPIDSLVKS